MLTKTSINRSVIINTLKAMRLAMVQSVAHVRNRRGMAYLAVRSIRCGGRVLFEVTDKSGRNVSKLLNDAVKRLSLPASWSNIVANDVADTKTVFVIRQTLASIKAGKLKSKTIPTLNKARGTQHVQ